MKRFCVELLAVLIIACGPIPAPQPPTQPPAGPPPAATLAFDVVACKGPFKNNYCDGPAGAVFRIKVGNPDTWLTFNGDANGYAWASGIPNVPDSDIEITAPGYDKLTKHISPPVLVATNARGVHNVWDVVPSHFDPTNVPLNELAAIRGSMWPQTQGACGNLPIGPRPGQPTNIFATVFINNYSRADADCMTDELVRVRGYTHAVSGPLVDSDGYHGVWTPTDWRGNWNGFLDNLQYLWDRKLKPVVYIKPDNWKLDDTKNEFTQLLLQPRAQKLIRIVVPMGWEAGADYEYSSCTWAEAGKWVRNILPNALVLVHLPADRDAPTGGDSLCNDDDKVWNPGGNAAGWGRVTPFYHGWLIQNNAFECPTCIAPNGKTNFQNFKDQFDLSVRASMMDRFHNGYVGWPTFSAWPDRPLMVYAGEYSAYWRFWFGRLEPEGVAWGNASIEGCRLPSGPCADGYLDSGSQPVTVH